MSFYSIRICAFVFTFVVGLCAALPFDYSNKSVTDRLSWCKNERGGTGTNRRRKFRVNLETAPGVITREEFFSMPRAEYTEEARKNKTAGVVRLKVTFSATGEITNITPLNNLPDGLTEQAIDAARRIKFTPRLKNGVPVTFSRTLEYNFTLY